MTFLPLSLVLKAQLQCTHNKNHSIEVKALPVARFILVYIVQEYSLISRLEAGSSLGGEAAGVSIL